jgi:hypothetical protein
MIIVEECRHLFGIAVNSGTDFKQEYETNIPIFGWICIERYHPKGGEPHNKLSDTIITTNTIL